MNMILPLTGMMAMLLPLSAIAEKSSINDYWKFADLLKNEQGNYLKLAGLLQVDSAWFDADQGEYNDLTWRRFQFGFAGKYGGTSAVLEAAFNLNNELSDSYKALTNAYFSWQLDDIGKLTVLKHVAGFSLDGKTSSKKLLTPQRNNLTHNLWFSAEHFTGISLKGDISEDWSYNAGAFSSSASDGISFSGASYFGLLTINNKLAKNDLWDKGSLHIDYVYNDSVEEGKTLSLNHVLSLSSKFQQGQWNLWTDIGYGEGALGQSDLWGAVIMPYYQQTEVVQWVARYTYLNSQNANGLRLAKYENKIVTGKGNNYNEMYGGVNFLLNSHKLKFHVGVQYTQMDDNADDGGAYDGWGLTVALRSYW